MIIDPINETDSIPGTGRVHARRGGGKTWTVDASVVRAPAAPSSRSSVTSLRLSITIPCTRACFVVE
jgi:hypothetical protein